VLRIADGDPIPTAAKHVQLSVDRVGSIGEHQELDCRHRS
jgi:hypothetical protein